MRKNTDKFKRWSGNFKDYGFRQLFFSSDNELFGFIYRSPGRFNVSVLKDNMGESINYSDESAAMRVGDGILSVSGKK